MNASEQVTIPSPVAPSSSDLLRRYSQLKQYVKLSEEEIAEAIKCWRQVEPTVQSVVDDFYDQILQHHETRRILSNQAQVERLKQSLKVWISELFSGVYDEKFVMRRWQVGFRHVQIGLSHVWVNAAMARLREELLTQLQRNWDGCAESYNRTASTLRRLIDLDLALIEKAYHAESVAQHVFQEKEFAEGVIDTAQAIVMVITLDGKIVRSNSYLNKLIDDPAQSQPRSDVNEGSSRSILEHIPNDEHSSVKIRLQEVASQGDSKPFESHFRLKSGEMRCIRWLARPFVFVKVRNTRSLFSHEETDGELDCILCVGQDITDLRQAQALLVRQERLAAIGQTMTGLAHESRNAFQRSQAALETLALELEDRPAAVELIERIQRAHDHLLHLYEEVLQFARPVRLEPRRVDIESLISQTWNHILQTEKSGSVKLHVKNSARNHEMLVDPFALEQVLRNVLENAVQASAPDSVINIELKDEPTRPYEWIVIQVRDFGCGLPKEYVSRVFEPFFTTRPKGTGLGLSIARRLVESHGGMLDLKAAEGPGCVATIALPLSPVLEKMSDTEQEDTRRLIPEE